MIPLLVPLEAATEPLHTRLGQSPQLNWRLPTTPRSFTTMDYGSAVTSTVLDAQTPKSNKILKGLVGGIKFLLVEVWIEAFSTTPEQINEFDWLGSGIGRNWSLEQQWSLGLEETSQRGRREPLI